MIKINNNGYENNLYEITIGKYSLNLNGKKVEGKSPYIVFSLQNIDLGLELIYDINKIKELKEHDKKDITNYLSDIIFEDEKGVISLIHSKYQCYIERLDKTNYIIEFNCNTEESDEILNISLKEKINMI